MVSKAERTQAAPPCRKGRCESDGHRGRGDRGGKFLGHLAGRDGVDLGRATHAQGSRQTYASDEGVPCASSGRPTDSGAGGRAWAQRHGPSNSRVVACDVGGKNSGAMQGSMRQW
jgi:hypothetical protein